MMCKRFVAVLLLATFLACCSFGALLASAAAVALTPETFEERVTTDERPWFVDFYAPWCGHCKKLAPTWDTLADAVKEHVNVGKLNCDEHKEFCQRLEVRGFPTLRLYKTKNPIEFEPADRARELKSLKEYLGAHGLLPDHLVRESHTADASKPAVVHTLVSSQEQLINLGISFAVGLGVILYCCGRKRKIVSSSSPSSSSGGKSTTAGSIPHVENLEQLNKLLEDAQQKLVVVDFYAQWCAPCKRIAPEIEALSQQEKNVIFVKVDVDAARDVAGRYNITSMPTFLFFRNNAKIAEVIGANLAAITTKVTELR